MLNIGRMGPGSQRYYCDHVAHDDGRGATGYYLDRGEAPGVWLGAGTGEVGLSGQVTPSQLSAVLAGQHLGTGQQLAAHPARKVPGFDLTFRAPKSVSLLWALADDPQVAAEVQAAHDAAVGEAVGYLERHAVRSRRGAGGSETVTVDGLIGAAFQHRTSRAGDPLLHTHVLAANLARTTDDGVWRTLDSRRLYAHAKTAGTVYQAALRHHLTATLGVAWEPVRNGYADLAGVERPWIDAFSKRRAAIVHELAQRGESSAQAAQVATLATRQAKPTQPSEAELRTRWAREAHTVKITAGWWQPLLDRRRPTVPNAMRLAEQLVGPEGVTAHTATFRPRDLTQQIAAVLPEGATAQTVEALAEHILTHGIEIGEIVPLGPDTTAPLAQVGAPTDREDGRYSVRGLLLTEQHALHQATARRDTDASVADPAAITDAIGRRSTLSDEQATMIRALCAGGDGVAVVVGKAGTGKTYALDAAREAWTTTGIRVSGVALAARAAVELQDSAGIPSTTLARLLGQLEDPTRPGAPLQPGQVLVVDEAGMIGTRQLARLLDHTRRLGVKTVLVGDPRQLPEIDAGGLFVALTRRLPAIELTENRRQATPWERAVLNQLRSGNVEAAVTEYREHGRIVTADTAEAIREQLVADWWTLMQHEPDHSAVMVALRRNDVDDLNTRARMRMATAGRLTGPTLTTGQLDLRVGDRIVCLRNNRALGVVNGTRATITTVTDHGGIAVLDDHGRTLTLPTDYLAAGHVTHGYAITGHKAQGLTVDHTFVLGSPALYREWGYVTMSRGRHTNRLYLHAVPDLEPDAHLPPPHIDPIATATRRLGRTATQTPVTDQADRAVADAQGRLATAQQWLGRPQVQTAIRLHAQLDQDVEKHARTLRRHKQMLAQYEQLGIGLTRTTRAERRQLHDSLTETTRQLHDLDRRIAATRRDLNGLPGADWIERVRDAERTARRDLDRLLKARMPQPEAPVRQWAITRGRGR